MEVLATHITWDTLLALRATCVFICREMRLNVPTSFENLNRLVPRIPRQPRTTYLGTQESDRAWDKKAKRKADELAREKDEADDQAGRRQRVKGFGGVGVAP